MVGMFFERPEQTADLQYWNLKGTAEHQYQGLGFRGLGFRA